MTETDLEREASHLFRELGLKAGAESLNFFLGESVHLCNWKKLLKPPRIAPSNGITMAESNNRSLYEKSHAVRKLRPRPLAMIEPLATTDRYIIDSSSDDHHVRVIPNGKIQSLDQDYYGECGICSRPVIGEKNGCIALEQIYHNSCFKCSKCSKPLSGGAFYIIRGSIVCAKDYRATLELCHCCNQVIEDKILRALGHTYHAVCFRCSVCGKGLDGVPFASDYNKKIYCEMDFHRAFAPLCAVCQDPIVPLPGERKSRRVIALDKSFHPHCYKCEDCGHCLAATEGEEKCYPIGDHLLCLSCNRKRIMTDGLHDSEV